VNILFRNADNEKRTELTEEYRERFANPFRAAELGYIDEVILPEQTRAKLIAALEMAQNSMRYSWDGAEVDAKLVGIMKNIHKISVEAAEGAGLGYNLVAGANIAGFKKVAAAMMAQGLV